MMRKWTDGISTVSARTEQSARRKLEVRLGYAVDVVRIDHESEAWAELPDCPCGWSGPGTGRGGAIVRGDRCPSCGAGLD